MANKLFKNIVGIAALGLLLCVLFLLFRTAYTKYYQAAYPMKYEALISRCCSENGVPLALAFAVVRSESGFCPTAQSSVGARGLMQITKPTFEWALFRSNTEEELSFEQLYDPEINIQYGTFILSLLLQEFGDERTALCAYHAGWGIVKEWLQNPECSADGKTLYHIPYADTHAYVKKVMETKVLYSTLYGV